jgi:hypothetical protein
MRGHNVNRNRGHLHSTSPPEISVDIPRHGFLPQDNNQHLILDNLSRLSIGLYQRNSSNNMRHSQVRILQVPSLMLIRTLPPT